jgi:polar amino acid transport system substrate-binding protein
MTLFIPSARRRAVRHAASLFCSVMLAPIGLAHHAAAQEPAPLRLCADPDNLPFSSANEATPGFYVELGREIAQQLGRTFQPVWVPTYNTKRQVRQKMLAGQCDGFVGVPDDASFMGPRLIFSQPVAQLGYALVAPPAMGVNAVADLSGRRVAVQWSSPPQNLLAASNDVQTVTVLAPEEAMQDLRDGKADAAFIWGATAGWLNKSAMQDAYRVVPVEGDHMQWSAAIAFPRTATALRDDIDHALGALEPSIKLLSAKYGFPGPASTQLAANRPGAQQTEAPDASETPSPVPDVSANPADIEAGQKLFNENCSHCHGPNAVQGEQRRNLRLLRQRYGDGMPRTFIQTVTHGRVNKGMPNWNGIISMDEFQKILAFLASVQEPAS